VIRKNNAQGIPAAGEDPNLRGGVIEIDDSTKPHEITRNLFSDILRDFVDPTPFFAQTRTAF
jgi:hypothetical protein